MVEESRRISINSNWVEGEKVLPGARAISSSVNRVRRLKRAVLHWERGRRSAIKKIIQDVQDYPDVQPIANYPFETIRNHIEKEGCTLETEGEYGVEEVKPLPVHP